MDEPLASMAGALIAVAGLASGWLLRSRAGAVVPLARRQDQPESPQLDHRRNPDLKWSDQLATIQNLLNAISAHAAILDQHGVIVATNKAWELFSRQGNASTSATSVGANYLAVCDRAAEASAPGDANEAANSAAQIRAVLGGERQEAFVRYPCHGPTRHQWYQMRAVRFEPVQGAAPLLLVCHENVTQTVRDQHAVMEEADRISRETRVMTAAEIASGLAHELSQPLAAISNYAAGLIRLGQQGPIDTDARARTAEGLRHINEQTQRARAIIESMRAMVSRAAFKPTCADARESVRAAVALVEHCALAGACPLECVLPDMPLVVLHDPTQLQQVVVNLLVNAIDAQAAQPPHTRHVRVELLLGAGSVGQPCVKLRIADRGPGVADADRGRIFQPFFTTKAHGSGLGLMICERVSDLHGGELSYQHRAGGGAVFQLLLPAQAVARAAA